jgi:hypothetical protein
LLWVFPESFQEVRDQVIGQPEAIGAQLRNDRSGSIEHTQPSRACYDAKSTNHLDPSRERDGSAITLIDQQCIRAKLLSQENRGGLACIQAEILNGRILDDLDPRCRLECGDNVRTRPRLDELSPHCPRHENPIDDGWNEVEPTDARKVERR